MPLPNMSNFLSDLHLHLEADMRCISLSEMDPIPMVRLSDFRPSEIGTCVARKAADRNLSDDLTDLGHELFPPQMFRMSDKDPDLSDGPSAIGGH